jgi:hypothetical protein
MHAYIYGWRRKAGCTTLLLALILSCLWVRSLGYQDGVMIFGVNRCLMITSADSSMSWAVSNPDEDGFNSSNVVWISRPITRDNGNDVHATYVVGTPRFVYYSPIVVPLTLLSACLILWKPRKRPPHV